jgi:hypothetical protein
MYFSTWLTPLPYIPMVWSQPFIQFPIVTFNDFSGLIIISISQSAKFAGDYTSFSILAAYLALSALFRA